MIVVSPHLDDAVLSCGQVLAAAPGSRIITVLAGVPDELPVTDYDVRSGFTSAKGAVAGRRAEDRRACAVLDAEPVHLDFYDRQYGRLNTPAEIIEALVPVLADRKDVVLVPVGLVHPDHLLVTDCALEAARRAGRYVVRYEELPARVLWPERVAERLGPDPQPEHLVAGDLHLKEIAVSCYRSQAWALNRHACLVPERFWT